MLRVFLTLTGKICFSFSKMSAETALRQLLRYKKHSYIELIKNNEESNFVISIIAYFFPLELFDMKLPTDLAIFRFHIEIFCESHCSNSYKSVWYILVQARVTCEIPSQSKKIHRKTLYRKVPISVSSKTCLLSIICF